MKCIVSFCRATSGSGRLDAGIERIMLDVYPAFLPDVRNRELGLCLEIHKQQEIIVCGRNAASFLRF
jgi:hypothetical protein